MTEPEEQLPSDPPPHAGRDLTVGSIPRHLGAFAAPMVVGSALQTSYSLVNGFWVGRQLSPASLAAVTVSQPVIFVTIAAAGGLTLATNILVAQYYGGRNYERIKSVVQTSTVLVVGVSLLLLLLGLLLSAPLLRAMDTPASIFPAALSYLRVIFWTLPLSFGLFLISSMLRGIGDSKTPVYFQAVSVVINAILDPLLMFGYFGFPRLGLNGTAYATILAQGVAVVALMLYLPGHRPLVMPDWRRLRVHFDTALTLFRIGGFSMVQQSMVSLSMVFIVKFVSRFGADVDAAFGAAIRLDSVAFLPALTIGMAISTLAGQNIGARRLDRVRETFRWGVLLSGGVSLAIMLVVISFPQVFLHAFLPSQARGVVAVGVGYLHIVAFTYVAYAIMFASNGIINGAGYTNLTMAITAATLLGLRIPLAYWLPRLTHSPVGIWYAMLISVTCGMVLSLLCYFSPLGEAPRSHAGVRPEPKAHQAEGGSSATRSTASRTRSSNSSDSIHGRRSSSACFRTDVSRPERADREMQPLAFHRLGHRGRHFQVAAPRQVHRAATPPFVPSANPCSSRRARISAADTNSASHSSSSPPRGSSEKRTVNPVSPRELDEGGNLRFVDSSAYGHLDADVLERQRLDGRESGEHFGQGVLPRQPSVGFAVEAVQGDGEPLQSREEEGLRELREMHAIRGHRHHADAGLMREGLHDGHHFLPQQRLAPRQAHPRQPRARRKARARRAISGSDSPASSSRTRASPGARVSPCSVTENCR